MAVIRVVLDTSIYVSALLASKGASGRILEAGFECGLFVPVTSPAILDELIDVIAEGRHVQVGGLHTATQASSSTSSAMARRSPAPKAPCSSSNFFGTRRFTRQLAGKARAAIRSSAVNLHPLGCAGLARPVPSGSGDTSAAGWWVCEGSSFRAIHALAGRPNSCAGKSRDGECPRHLESLGGFAARPGRAPSPARSRLRLVRRLVR